MLDALRCSLPRGILHAPRCLTQLSLQALLCRRHFTPPSSAFAILPLPFSLLFTTSTCHRAWLLTDTLHCCFLRRGETGIWSQGTGTRNAPWERRGNVCCEISAKGVIRSVMRRREIGDGLQQWPRSVTRAELLAGHGESPDLQIRFALGKNFSGCVA